VRIVARPAPDGGVTAEVSDTGPGIAPEMREVLFDPFRSAVTPEGNQGSGLGLAIAHQLTRALGGDLTAGDAADGGACFTLRLPAQAPAPKNDEGPPSEMDEGPTPTAMGGQA
jgi:two-component system sensor histidine kinase MprB